MSGEGGFELRGVVRPLALFCRHLALLALCPLFSRQATSKSEILCTHTAWKPSGLHFLFEVKKSEKASLTIFELSCVTSSGLEGSLKCSPAIQSFL
jgi:hypothetical protein